MASPSVPSLLFSSILVTVTLFFSTPPATCIPPQELERALSALRSRGHALFANAITTSDFLFDLLSADSLTLLGPTDSSLFALDMTLSLPLYVSTLRIHALPTRLSLSDLRSLPNASSLFTLLPPRRLFFTRPTSGPTDSFDLDGVRVVLPGLFFSRHVAAHGLAGVLPFTNAWTPPPPSSNPTIALPPSDGAASDPQSREAAVSPAPELSHMILPPSTSAHPKARVPVPGAADTFQGFAPKGSSRISQHPATKSAAGARDQTPQKVGEVGLLQLASLRKRTRAREDKISETATETPAMKNREY